MTTWRECERQLQTRRQAAEKQMAMEIAVGREQFKYFGSFCALTGVGLLAASIKKKRPSLLAPMVPLGFLVAYQYDVAYGTFQMRVLGEAENVIISEHHRLGQPFGPVTFSSIETARGGGATSS
ncbi:plasminogen receptor (KT) [Cynoglossus semilaevis]|uniref:plasminogen receptor (KT) n=1 Tax=Cynoglossus semilaevis TaxID=244447 RepID=UPI0007DC9297|nr:plasminogen receptor (KT) [Cynoglossus semilaevis]